MNPSIPFLLIFVIASIYLILYFYINGKKALSIFPDLTSVNIKYRESGVSGCSLKSRQTKMGGANKILELIVTDDELWLKSNLIAAAVGQRFDLIHKIKLESIQQIREVDEGIQLDFITDENEKKELILISKNPAAFLQALKNSN